MKVVQASHCDVPLLEEVNSLLPQLSTSAQLLTLAELKTIIESDTTDLLLAVEDGQIHGILTLAVFQIPTGIRGWVEDVVVRESSRGKGAGKALLEAAIEFAKGKGAKSLDLTSRPSRVAANSLYQKIGFVKRDTNVYRLVL